jgi:CubicO group peptidase (beta-lactamase class C family)
VLSAKTVERMTANGLPPAIQSTRGGVGWALANVNVVLDPSRGGEYGWDGTAGTIFWVNPTTEMITVLMTQSSPANPDSLRQRFKRLIDDSLEVR